jgi:hypothetical protein
MSALLEYECRVPRDGYEVITIEVPVSPVLNEKRTVLQPRSERTERFDLFKSPDAFLEFAQTPLTDGIKAFADRYGPLEVQRRESELADWLEDDGVKDLGLALDDTVEPKPVPLHRDLLSWARNIREMRRAVELWEMSKSTGDFSKIVRRVNKGLVQSGVLTDGVSVELLLKRDPSSGSARLCIRPYSLLRALWAQLVVAIDGGANLGACVKCGNWFMFEAGRGRSDKAYCSNACRQRAYRDRKSSG